MSLLSRGFGKKIFEETKTDEGKNVGGQNFVTRCPIKTYLIFL